VGAKVYGARRNCRGGAQPALAEREFRKYPLYGSVQILASCPGAATPGRHLPCIHPTMETDMKLVALAALAAIALAVPASAQVGSGVPECERNYRAFWTGMLPAAKALTGPQLAQVHRYALRGYDGCTSGDERFKADDFFKRLEAIKSAKADEFFRELEKSFPAKK
jgi:hypothetical protein